jgi:hypothetical protein
MRISNVTNSPARGWNEGDDDSDSFWAKETAIEARGVPVLVARGPGTFDAPHK